MGSEIIRRIAPTLEKPGPGENEIIVKFDKVEYKGNEEVVVTQKSLVESLIKHSVQTLQLLSLSIAPIKLEDISIDDQLRVVITSPNFVNALRNKQLPDMYNTFCSNYSCS